MKIEYDKENNLLTVHNLRNRYNIETLKKASKNFDLFGSLEYEYKKNVFDLNKADEKVRFLIDTSSEEKIRDTIDNMVFLENHNAWNSFKLRDSEIPNADYFFFALITQDMHNRFRYFYMEAEDLEAEMKGNYAKNGRFLFEKLGVYTIVCVCEREKGTTVTELFLFEEETWGASSTTFIPNKKFMTRLEKIQNLKDVYETEGEA